MAAVMSCAKPQALPSATDARPRWSVQHIQTGGIGGGHFDTTLDDDGTLHVCDSTGPAPSDKVTAADTLVRRLRAHGAFLSSRPADACPGCSDAFHITTVVTYAGERYWLDSDGGADADSVRDLTSILMEVGRAACEKITEDRFQRSDHFTLGRVWLVEEEIRDRDWRAVGTIESVWTRRGNTSVFDATWENGATGERGTDVIDFLGKRAAGTTTGHVTLDARAGLRRYEGSYQVTRDHHISSYGVGDVTFEAEILDDSLDASSGPRAVPAPWMSKLRLNPVRTPRPVPLMPTLVPRPAISRAQTAGTLNDAVAVASGNSGACAIRTDGSVVCWSTSTDAILGSSSSLPPSIPRSIRFPADAGAAHAHEIAVGDEYACALLEDRSVWCWGNHLFGSPRTGRADPERMTAADGLPVHAVSIGAINFLACLVSDAGEVLCWDSGVGHGNPAPPRRQPLPHPLDPRSAIVRVGGFASCAMDAHDLACWGGNTWGGLASSDPQATFTGDVAERLTLAGAVAPLGELTVGLDHACVSDARHGIWCWGANGAHQLGDDTYAPQRNARAVRFAAFPDVSPKRLIAGALQTCVVGGPLAALFCTGGTRQGRPDDAAAVSISWASGGSLTGVLSASLLGSYRCAVVSYEGAPASAGQVACWGLQTGAPIVPGRCSLNGPPDLCLEATPVTAPAP
jgi:hypothetical protein